ncbi:MAG TPA: YceH family protein [Thermoanaerobaculia bacterium]|nr:YceH family protein [Thermoanaerobaculia bacterium]
MDKLDAVGCRIIGSLIEKQLTTPDNYPLTLNALVAACNQKTNREPVTELGEDEVSRALDRLQQRSLAWRVLGGRSVRWDHNADKRWLLTPETKALIALLLLRGPQTSGELRSRSDRMFLFESIDDVESALRALSGRDEPLVASIPRRAGQKEDRWISLAGDIPPDDKPARASEAMEVRLARLEALVGRMEAELAELKLKLGE